MKKLSQEELLNLTEEKAWTIAESFGKYLENNSNRFLEFEDHLEYERESILVALLFLLRKNTTNREFVNVVSNNIVLLFSSFIPSTDDYQKKLELKKRMEETNKKIK